MGLADAEEISVTGAAAAQLKGKEQRVTVKAFPNGEKDVSALRTINLINQLIARFYPQFN